MKSKRILVIDQDEMVLSILKKSLQGYEPSAEIIPMNAVEPAMEALKTSSFDAVIVDFALLTRDDYLVFEQIKSSQNPLPILAVTAYPNTDLTLARDGLQIAHTLLKPVEMGNLNTLCKKIFSAVGMDLQASLNMTEQLYEESQKMMDQLLRETNSRCIVLSDTDGRLLLKSGNTQDMPIDEVAALLGGGIATLLEAGKNLADEAVINLIYREGKVSDLYAVNIGVRLFLVLVIDRGPFYNRLGTVWFYARQAAIKLMDNMEKATTIQPTKVFDESSKEAYSSELDKLFTDLNI